MSTNTDNNFLRLGLEKSLRDLPALPGIVSQVIQETQSADASAQKIEKLLSSDQALASKVLRVVNSAYYGLSGQITSLSQAIMILGMPQVRNLVLSVSAISTMKPKTARQEETLKCFWLHAFGTAHATQCIARAKRLNVGDSEAMLLGGLLHDVGRLFLYSTFSQTYDQVLKYASDHQITPIEAEQRLLGMSHSQIGGAMARHWNLPDALTELIENHEGPFTPETAPTVLAVHVGDTLTKHLYELPEGAIPESLDPDAEAWLAYSVEELDNLKRETECRIEEAANLFGAMAA